MSWCCTKQEELPKATAIQFPSSKGNYIRIYRISIEMTLNSNFNQFKWLNSNFNQTKLLRNQNFNQFKWLWIQILIHFRTRRFPLEIFKFESNSNLISIQMTLNSKLNQLKWLWTQMLINSNLIQSQWVLTPSEGLIIWLFY